LLSSFYTLELELTTKAYFFGYLFSWELFAKYKSISARLICNVMNCWL